MKQLSLSQVQSISFPLTMYHLTHVLSLSSSFPYFHNTWYAKGVIDALRHEALDWSVTALTSRRPNDVTSVSSSWSMWRSARERDSNTSRDIGRTWYSLPVSVECFTGLLLLPTKYWLILTSFDQFVTNYNRFVKVQISLWRLLNHFRHLKLILPVCDYC